MINIKREGILLSPSGLQFEDMGVLNPAVIRVGDSVHLYYRAVQKGNHSTIGYCRLDGPLTVVERWEKPLIVPEFEYESHGVEDPRITKIDDLYYLTYTGYDGINARGALAVSKDLLHFEKHGMIVPPQTYAQFVSIVEGSEKISEDYWLNPKFYYQSTDIDKKKLLWDKNVIFFPRRINNKLMFLHRLRPGIQLVAINELGDLTKEYWNNYFRDFHKHIVLDPLYEHESSYIGGGCPPIETEYGWLIIYHGVKRMFNGTFVYSACAALLNLENPLIEIGRLPYALLSPEMEWELKGEVNNVVFPTGAVLFGSTLYIYYGAADSLIGCASLNITDLVQELMSGAMNS
ncbi:glycoside hydrolase family 130 protein [Alkaliflexus imshenetskii]|uniref:glycoside hydrolase family 130 protein n=1 Tax=Alkaliflexus imshenetskii TaxID=286730 RepID=UPI00047AD20E|nr:pesticidal protein Cry7Aa [Alkaliflexus imshenetskii]